MDAYGVSDCGLKREVNQDTILVDLPRALFVVADGMGGHKGGGVASQVAVESFSKYVYNALNSHKNSSVGTTEDEPAATKGEEAKPPVQVIREAFARASLDVYQKSIDDNLRGMGTTLVCAWLVDEKVYVGYVGDSRAYLFHKNQLWQMTEDHSLENEKRRLGLPEKAMQEVRKNIITRCVGFQPDVVCDVVVREVHKGDLVLLCSDGLSGAVSDEHIQQLCDRQKTDLKGLVEEGVQMANKAGGMDNVSVVAIRI